MIMLKDNQVKVGAMKSQQGIAGTMIVLILLLVGVAGFGGWVVYNNTQNKDEASSIEPGEFPESQSGDDSDTAEKEEQHTHRADDWLLFETSKYSLRLPDGWKLLHQTDGDVLYSQCTEADCLTVNEGTDAVVTKTEGGRDGISGLIVAYDSNLTEPREFKGSEGTAFITTDDGLSFEVHKTVTDTESEIGTPPVGTVTYEYYYRASEKEGMYIAFVQYPGVVDVKSVVEEIIHTVKLVD